MSFRGIKDELNKVENDMQRFYFPAEENIHKLIGSCFSKNGKRIRPALAILSAKAAGNINQKVIKIAALVEIIHLASLLHDDVVDNSDKRRGSPSANMLWGNKASIIVADYFISKGILGLCRQEYLKCIRIISDTIVRMSLGQLKEILNKGNFNLSVKDYKDIIEKKTASLFSSTCQMGSLLSGAQSRHIEALKNFGTNYGMAFQITDDLLDFWGETEALGKPTGNDILQKNFTLPVIYCFGRADAKEKNILKKYLSNGGNTEDKFQDLIRIMDKYNTKKYVENIAAGYIEKAVSFLSVIKESHEKQALKDFATEIINRKC